MRHMAAALKRAERSQASEADSRHQFVSVFEHACAKHWEAKETQRLKAKMSLPDGPEQADFNSEFRKRWQWLHVGNQDAIELQLLQQLVAV